jgi:transcriptional regulator with XRE-family HTH domain
MTEQTAGHRALKAWYEKGERSQSAVALACGVSQSAVSQWIRGETRPAAGLAREALERMAGIAAGAWLTAAEKRKRAKVERAAAGEGVAK